MEKASVREKWGPTQLGASVPIAVCVPVFHDNRSFELLLSRCRLAVGDGQIAVGLRWAFQTDVGLISGGGSGHSIVVIKLWKLLGGAQLLYHAGDWMSGHLAIENGLGVTLCRETGLG